MGHRRASLAVVALLAAAVALGCTEKPETAVREPSGATAVTLTTEDGLALQARHWPADGERLAIYLHEYRSDQSAWWPYTRQVRSPGLSALTVDLRGHGESEGLPDDIEGMLADVRATLAFAREQGYRQVMLVGAGMGAALAISAAVDHPEVTVVGFSAP
ncbi:MAG: alpha/beta hydrolase, partial [Dehalococcoidia bacterium]